MNDIDNGAVKTNSFSKGHHVIRYQLKIVALNFIKVIEKLDIQNLTEIGHKSKDIIV